MQSKCRADFAPPQNCSTTALQLWSTSAQIQRAPFDRNRAGFGPNLVELGPCLAGFGPILAENGRIRTKAALTLAAHKASLELMGLHPHEGSPQAVGLPGIMGSPAAPKHDATGHALQHCPPPPRPHQRPSHLVRPLLLLNSHPPSTRLPTMPAPLPTHQAAPPPPRPPHGHRPPSCSRSRAASLRHCAQHSALRTQRQPPATTLQQPACRAQPSASPPGKHDVSTPTRADTHA